jgi:AraC-like DNA-binding protein
MRDGTRLYERAAREADALLPIWHLDRGRGLFVGPLTYNAPHAHSVPVYLAGVYDVFEVRIGGGAWRTCRTAVIPAGVIYELNIGGSPLAVLYLEPSEVGVDALTPLVHAGCEEAGALVGQQGELAVFRDLYEALDAAGSVGDALDSLLGFSKKRARRMLDPRISRAVADLALDVPGVVPIAEVARKVGLSSSRFQHIFADEIGVPFRRFRIWQRLRTAIAEVVAGHTFTAASYAAGFSDQAHFARAFRRTFGAPASPTLRNVRRARPVNLGGR